MATRLPWVGALRPLCAFALAALMLSCSTPGGAASDIAEAAPQGSGLAPIEAMAPSVYDWNLPAWAPPSLEPPNVGPAPPEHGIRSLHKLTPHAGPRAHAQARVWLLQSPPTGPPHFA